MNIIENISIKQIANLISAKVIGNENAIVRGLNEIHRTEIGDLTFVDHPKFHLLACNCAADFILTNQGIKTNKTQIISSQPFVDFIFLLDHFSLKNQSQYFENINGASISITAKIGTNTHIMPGAFIGNNVEIGNQCTIFPNVTIMDNCKIGNNVIINPNTVVGCDGFYYKKTQTTDNAFFYDKFKSYGNVIIGNSVELGSGCQIARGITSSTIIGDGSKLDNLVMIGHGVIIGKNCLLAAQVGVAGKTTLEDNVILWGQVGVNKNITIGKDCVVLAKSGVSKNLESGKTYFGIPAGEAKSKWKELLAIKHLVRSKK